MSSMRRICCLVAVLMMSSVLGPGSASEEADTPMSVDAIHNKRSPEAALCGRRPAATTRRNKGYERFAEDTDMLDKIAGGSAVRRGDIPWLVNIYDGRFHECGGAIVSEFWVLTTSRCVNIYYMTSYKIKVGDHQSTVQEQGEQTFRVQTIIPHDASLYGAEFNIALIKVKPTSDGRGIRFNNYVQPICLPNAGEFPAKETKVTISGWGRTSQSTPNLPFEPSQAVQPFKEHAFCTNIFDPTRFTRRMMCLGSVNGDSDVCLGDQGGPATYKFGSVYILAGIISTATDCTPPHMPIVLLSVAAHRNWIDMNINFNSKGPERVIPART